MFNHVNLIYSFKYEKVTINAYKLTFFVEKIHTSQMHYYFICILIGQISVYKNKEQH